MKTVVIYWSGTGVTEGIANTLAKETAKAGHETDMFSVGDFSGDIASYDMVLLGCSAQGAETLDEGEFEPFWNDNKAKIKDKKVGLFGSYGWGDGEWMRLWANDASSVGIKIATGEGLAIQEDDIQDSNIAEYVSKL